MDCNFAKDVWGRSFDLRAPPLQTTYLYCWLSALGCSTPKFDIDLLSKSLLICWQIWEARNNMLFHGSKAHPTCCIHAAATVGLGYWQLNSSVKKEKDIPMSCKGHVGENSINVVESISLRDSLVATIERGWNQIVVEGDSKLVIDSILKNASPPWSIQQIIQDIWSLSSFVAAIRFQHVFREANFKVDAIAKLGHGLSAQVCWELGLPLSVCSPFYFDFFEHSCPRGFVL
ncbi:hypothetical protein L3X38_003401 [Prunus dulcis]|uniref:RNase H type-1 domain-containing protein n=1 Tax=Prunus dulcis TaxID=3755 RepID=A0AAD5F228_PRUDU|nr:hypothetical protein L3X38_003401 [Prunus dulcis]